MSFSGIDLGTSFIKGAVLDLDDLEIRHIQRLPFPNRLASPNPLFCEFDPDQIVSAVRNFIGELVSSPK